MRRHTDRQPTDGRTDGRMDERWKRGPPACACRSSARASVARRKALRPGRVLLNTHAPPGCASGGSIAIVAAGRTCRNCLYPTRDHFVFPLYLLVRRFAIAAGPTNTRPVAYSRFLPPRVHVFLHTPLYQFLRSTFDSKCYLTHTASSYRAGIGKIKL